MKTANDSGPAVAGTTLIETLVAITLLVVFFVAIFQVNAKCLGFVNSSKEAVGALQGVEDRVEQFRNLSFSSLTSASAVQTLMTTPANGSSVASKVTETVTLSAYPTPDATNTKLTRGPGSSVTPTINTTDSNLVNAALVKVKVHYTWSTALGGRSMSEQTETIIAPGTKK